MQQRRRADDETGGNLFVNVSFDARYLDDFVKRTGLVSLSASVDLFPRRTPFREAPD